MESNEQWLKDITPRKPPATATTMYVLPILYLLLVINILILFLELIYTGGTIYIQNLIGTIIVLICNILLKQKYSMIKNSKYFVKNGKLHCIEKQCLSSNNSEDYEYTFEKVDYIRVAFTDGLIIKGDIYISVFGKDKRKINKAILFAYDNEVIDKLCKLMAQDK